MRLLLSLTYFLSFALCAENIWLDNNWNQVSSDTEASYFMKSPLEKSGERWVGTIYYRLTQMPRFKGGFNGPDIGKDVVQVGHYEYFYENGKLKSVGERNLHGEFIGKTIFYDEDGHVTEERYYIDGQLNGIQRIYFPSGNVKREYEMDHGVVTNQALDYYENGARKAIQFYRFGKLHGDIKEFYADGKLRREVTYVNGDIQGKETFYHENGTKASEVNYLNGQKEGVYFCWSPDGIVIVEKNYVDNQADGESRHYNDKGKLLSVKHFKAGQVVGEHIEYFPEKDQIKLREVYDLHHHLLIREKYDESGTILYKFNASYRKGEQRSDVKHYRHGKLSKRERVDKSRHWTLTETYDRNGVLSDRLEHVNGKREGVFKDTVYELTANGRAVYIKTLHYKNGLKEGPYQSIAADKSWYKQGQYKHGKKVGIWRDKSANGEKYIQYDEHGLLHGEQKTVSSQGDIILLAHYRHGQLHGNYEAFDLNQQLIAKGRYQNGLKQGEWFEVGENNLTWKGSYVDDHKVAGWMALSTSGYVLAKGQYDRRGRKYGDFYYFDESGLLRRKMHFQQDIKHGEEVIYNLDKAQEVRHFNQGKLTRTDVY